MSIARIHKVINYCKFACNLHFLKSLNVPTILIAEIVRQLKGLGEKFFKVEQTQYSSHINVKNNRSTLKRLYYKIAIRKYSIWNRWKSSIRQIVKIKISSTINWYIFIHFCNILNKKKERYIKFSLKLRIFHLNIVKECIVIYNHRCFMVDMSCRGDR